eukprot:CAMPEP_0174329840 /NCGR_PEP_ID=MMETSP0810-20121108/16183_1 /TAXON_ID=73025 ORGANISM="Eutreptiella gymnastica-like, Strain CCMP1594" /NCGR_SAMPLE_ID=MMETSP0810 /ASSEMBLY_ACC=CAM_ASM_000659 /LENGTH=324 /DNA_ID=CAMNT_0015444617 /DNA_START=18 /DNA_END=992 /DNA_ORIENTATION=-
MASSPANPTLFPILNPDLSLAQLKTLTYYQVLGVRQTASADELQTNYDLLSISCHPYVARSPDNEARFQLLAEAYATLRDPARRRAYDTSGQRESVPQGEAQQFFEGTKARWAEWAENLRKIDASGLKEVLVKIKSLHKPGGKGWFVTGALSGACFGATLGGPVGAVIGCTVGAAGGAWRAATGQHVAASATDKLAAAMSDPETREAIRRGLGNMLEAIADQQSEQRNGPEAASSSSSSSSSSPSDSQRDLTVEELQAIACTRAEEGAADNCKICLTNKINAMLIPCSHIALCSQCAALVMQQDRKCPVCRAQIQKVHAPVYIS